MPTKDKSDSSSTLVDNDLSFAKLEDDGSNNFSVIGGEIEVSTPSKCLLALVDPLCLEETSI